jgi:hypothetical protein
MYEGRYLVDELMAYVTPVSYFNDNAVTLSSYVSSIITKAPIVDSKLMTETKDIKNILIVWTGTNDIATNGYTGQQIYDLLKPYVQARVAAGWKVFCYTTVPRSWNGNAEAIATQEQTRVDLNTLLRTDLDLLDDVYVLDTDTLSVLDDPTDTTYYSDGVHLTWEGNYHAATLFGTKIAEVYANIVAQSMPESGTTEMTLAANAAVISPSYNFSEVTTLTVDGNANFYADAAGTLRERKQITMAPRSTYQPIYIKCTSGSYTLKMSNNKLTHIYHIAFLAPSAVTVDISDFPGLKYCYIVPASSAVSGDLSNLVDLEWINCVTAGICSIEGSLNLLTKITSISLSTSGAITGNTEDIEALADFYVDSSSASTDLSIDIETHASTLRSLRTSTSRVYGTGDLAACTLLTYVNISYQNGITYTTKTWANNQVYFGVRATSALYYYSVATISLIVIDASAVATWTSSKAINLLFQTSMADTTQGGIWGDYSGVPAPTALATAYKTLIRTKGVTVTLNSITVPGVSGDGTGFPAGFGDWYRS